MARPRVYRVSLSKKERGALRRIQKNTASSTVRSRCAVLLEADEKRWKRAKSNSEIATASGVSASTVVNALKLFCNEGIDGVVRLKRNPNSDTARLKATGDVEARIIAKAY